MFLEKNKMRYSKIISGWGLYPKMKANKKTNLEIYYEIHKTNPRINFQKNETMNKLSQ